MDMDIRTGVGMGVGLEAETEEVFERNGAFYYIPRDIHEIREKYVERAEYAISLIAEKNVKFEEAIRKSRMWANKKYLGCGYDEE